MAGGDDHDPLGLPVEHEAEVDLLRDVGGFLDPEPMHHLAARARLLGDQRLAEEVGGVVAHFRFGLADLHAARFAASAGMDLRLDHAGKAELRAT
jgi:hypothetical protein